MTLARELHERRSELGVELVGFVDSESRVGMPVVNPGVIGTVSEIPTIVGPDASIGSWSAWQMPEASSTWTSCSR